MEINVIAIICSLVIYILKRNSAKICTKFVSLFYTFESNVEYNEMLKEKARLTCERDSFNPIDEFAKYAIGNRKVSKVDDRIKAITSEYATNRMKNLMYTKVFFWVLIALMSISLIWYNYDKPIIDFTSMVKRYSDLSGDELAIFSPLSWFLAFPSTHRTNSIGVTVWLFVANRAMDILVNKIGQKTKTTV